MFKKKCFDGLLEKSGELFKTSDLTALGISKPTIARMVRDGLLENVAHGVYCRAGDIVDEMQLLQLRSPRIVFSHESALWLNGLSDRNPFEMSVTIERGAPLAASLRSACRCHYVPMHLMDIGLVTMRNEYGHNVRCYDAERTVCDIVRDRSLVGVEEFADGMKRYAVSPKRNLPRLMQFAGAFGVAREISSYMEVLT